MSGENMTRMRMRIRAAAGLAVAAIMTLAGCGGSSASAKPADSRTAATIIGQMKAAMNDATSVHLTGSVAHAGSTVGIDVSLTRTGGLAGSVGSGGVTLDLIKTGDLIYIEANSAFLKLAHEPATLCPKLCGKYVAVPASQAATMTGDLSMSKLFGDLLGSLPHFARTGTITIGGEQALVLAGSDGSTLDVAAHGNAYPLRAIAPKSAKAGEITFSQWNAVPVITAPPAGQVVNLSQLTG
jgi:hypothetical protein